MFHPELVSFLKLLSRRPDLGNGWREYSDEMQRLVLKMCKNFPGLFDTEIDDAHMKIRTTDECGILVKWMNYVPPKWPAEVEDEDDDAAE